MLIIECPYCGPRDQSEFSNGGEAHVKRPDGSQDISDREWAEYVFIRSNPKGLFYERWCTLTDVVNGLTVLRDTSTDEILKTYKIGDPKPDLKKFKNKIVTPSGEPELGSGNFTVKMNSINFKENPFVQYHQKISFIFLMEKNIMDIRVILLPLPYFEIIFNL